MKRNDLTGGVFFLAVGLLFTLYARSVEIGEWSEPGPGFLPFYAGMLMTALSAALVFRTLVKKRGEPAEAFFPVHDAWKRVVMVIGALMAYNLILSRGGFVITTFLFIGFLVRFVFPQTWMKSIVTAAVSTAAVWIIFIQLLKITFPRGLLGF